MSKTKVTCVAAFAALMLSLVGAASASAAAMTWFVNGTALTSGNQELANTAKVDEPAVLNAPGISLKISCATLKGSKAELQGSAAGESAMGQAEALEFEGCSEISPPTCKLVPSFTKIITRAILAIVLLILRRVVPFIQVLFEPKKGTTFAELKLEGEHCSIAGTQGVTGSVVVGAPTGASEETLQAIEGLGTTENNNLIIDGRNAYIEGGKALLKLASGKAWSFRE